MIKKARMLSLARKAGKLLWGFDSVKSKLGRDIKVVLFAKDLSIGSRRRMERHAADNSVPCAEAGMTIDEIWFYIGKRAGILALTDEGFAKTIMEMSSDADKGGTACGLPAGQ